MANHRVNLVDQKAKRIALVVAIGSVAAAGGYYLASPYLAIQGLRSGFLSKNADQVNQYIDYPSLQSDLKAQLGSMMLRSMQTDPEMAANPFSGFAMAMITPMVNSMVDTYITPSGMKSVLEASSTQQTGAIQDQTAQNLVERKKEFDKALQKTSMGYDGLNKFQLTATADDIKKQNWFSIAKVLLNGSSKALFSRSLDCHTTFRCRRRGQKLPTSPLELARF